MKELSVEQKAKRYDEVVAMAKEQLDGAKVFDYDNEQIVHDIRTTVYNIFPELKESEDEKIRKEIIKLVKFYYGSSLVCKHTISKDKMVAWLEKQREQKSIDKIEPKFHEGDWVVTDKGDTVQIGTVNNDYYTIGNGMLFSIPYVDTSWHLWTIEDAKDGDVLYSLDSCQPFIYKERKPHEQATAYCGINKYGRFFVGNTKDCVIVLDDYVPATKEQRDQLEMVMFEAGYEWDTKKKELKKIEDESENYKKKERTSESTIYEDDIHYSNDCADCTRDSCEDCYPY